MNVQAICLLKRSAAALALLLPMLLLSACETAPTAEELKSAHYGHYPSNYRSAANRILDNRHDALGDPFSTVAISTPQKDYRGGTGNRTWGYTSEVTYNAPNPSVGATIYHYREKIFFHNNEVVEVTNATNVGDVMLSAVASNLAVSVGDQGDGTDNADDGGGDDSTGTTKGKANRHGGGGKRTASKTNRTTASRTNQRAGGVQQQRKVAAPKPAPVTNKKKN